MKVLADFNSIYYDYYQIRASSKTLEAAKLSLLAVLKEELLALAPSKEKDVAMPKRSRT